MIQEPVETLGDRWARLPGIQSLLVAGAAALTFDDGPDPEGTPAVLDALDAAGLRATFFMLGAQVLRHSELAREVAARGHEIAMHGFEHADHDQLAPSDARDEVERAVWAFETVLAVRPRWFRPPFGHLSDASLEACRETDVKIVYWSASGNDWLSVQTAEIADSVAERLTDGAIVLLHDSARFSSRASVEPTAAAIAPIARVARGRGIELGSLCRMVDR
jgi:peptidoglycan-N-acetylglucosamine deacetylase